MRTVKHIGYVTLTKKQSFTRTYETAAWFQEIEVQPGRYPMNGVMEGTDVKEVLVGLPGKIIASCFDALYYGKVIKEKRNEDVGQDATYTLQMYGFSVANALLDKRFKGNAFKYELLPGFIAQVETHYIGFFDDWCTINAILESDVRPVGTITREVHTREDGSTYEIWMEQLSTTHRKQCHDPADASQLWPGEGNGWEYAESPC